MGTPLVTADSISFKSNGKVILQDINLTLQPKTIVTLIGPNGAGKTVLLSILLGLQQPSSGTVTRQDNLRIGYMPQRLPLNPQLPINVNRFLKLTNQPEISVKDALERTGVKHLLQSSMQTLSGGELQRVLLARALLRNPQLLVLDEPVQGVDVKGQGQLYQLISDLRDELACSILMVSHDLHLVMASTDHVICLNQHICCHGHPEKVSNHPAYLELFGTSQSYLTTYTHHHDHSHTIHGDIVPECNHDTTTLKNHQ